MDTRYDFTSHRIFSRAQMARETDDRRKDSGIAVPWDFHSIRHRITEEELSQKNPPLFKTGTAEEIEFRRNVKSMLACEACERCGKPMMPFPWERTKRTLCREWEEILDTKYGHIYPYPFANKKTDTAIPWWLDL